VNVSKGSDPDRLNNICVANGSDRAGVVKQGSIHMNGREFSDIEMFERSRKGISLFMFILCY
jgi:Fe-S cluster assembly ATPase SufC